MDIRLGLLIEEIDDSFSLHSVDSSFGCAISINSHTDPAMLSIGDETLDKQSKSSSSVCNSLKNHSDPALLSMIDQIRRYQAKSSSSGSRSVKTHKKSSSSGSKYVKTQRKSSSFGSTALKTHSDPVMLSSMHQFDDHNMNTGHQVEAESRSKDIASNSVQIEDDTDIASKEIASKAVEIEDDIVDVDLRTDTELEFGSTSENASKFVRIEDDCMNTQVAVAGVSGTANEYLPPEFFSPGGRQLFWIPKDVNDVKPKEEDVYANIDDAIAMYKAYATKAGFDVRMGTLKSVDKVLTHRYALCSREGAPQTVYVDTTDDQNNNFYRYSNIKRKGCPAIAKFRRFGGSESEKFQLYEFIEVHNHPLVTEDFRHFLRINRQLDLSTRIFLEKMARLNIGATKAYRIYKELKGSYNVEGGTVVDFKNQTRKVNCFMEKDDAQMVVDKYVRRMKEDSTLTFEFVCDKGALVSLFWADEAAKANFKEFGDIVSFDATFCTNKYCMVFVPFTGIDNHRKSVTFAIGLLSNETTESYVWLLKTFLKTFGKAPRMVVTDEDAAIKIAIERVFPQSRHRLCMWHITQKCPSRICPEVFDEAEFKKKFFRLIWNSRMDQKNFESRWKSIIEEYKLEENGWLKKMFDIRDMWIPAYFREIHLSSLMRTTSRSESANSAFNKTSHWGDSLVKFFRSFEAAMDRQRHNQCFLQHVSNTSKIKSKISLKILDHAAEVYTNEILKKVQKEIEASIFCCSQHSVSSEMLHDRFVVMEVRNVTDTSKEVESSEDEGAQYEVPEKTMFFKVVYDKKESNFDCSCRLFFLFGILCRHIFCVFRAYQISKIPSKYILRRWCKGVIPSEILMKKCSSDEGSSSSDSLSRKVLNFVEESVASLCKDQDKLVQFFELIKDAKLKVDGVSSSSSCSDSILQKDDIANVVESLYGVKIPTCSNIENPPEDISNKGSGTRKRLKGGKEKAITESLKQKRYCSNCKLYVTGHNRRTCERVQKQAREEAAATKKV